jgi:hypothetical protein
MFNIGLYAMMPSETHGPFPRMVAHKGKLYGPKAESMAYFCNKLICDADTVTESCCS